MEELQSILKVGDGVQLLDCVDSVFAC